MKGRSLSAIIFDERAYPADVATCHLLWLLSIRGVVPLAGQPPRGDARLVKGVPLSVQRTATPVSGCIYATIFDPIDLAIPEG